ncbi:MAG: aminoacyl-histidine dipeptidase [Spirochaetaceae bacterium]
MNLKLENILDIFTEINNIPRKSKNEEAISDWLVDWATKNHFEVERDTYLDVLIKVPGSAGYEDRETIIFQGHMDMVCEKIVGSKHNFATDPIKMYQEDGWLKATETSLGADNGIALAIAMALSIDPDVKHPPLELIFTVDEETGLTGAVNLPTNWLTGKTLINIDSEDEGVFTIGCAGGRDAKITTKRKPYLNKDFDQSLTLIIGGLKGGHSGVEIHLEKANANIILARLLNSLTKVDIDFGINNISGGSAHNAIARDSSATICLKSTDMKKAQDTLLTLIDVIKNEFFSSDTGITLELTPSDNVSSFSDRSIIDLILALPHGVANYSKEMEGIVETSCNLAVLSTSEKDFKILMSQRSSVMSRLDELCDKIDSVVSLANGSARFGGGYPSWQPDFHSAVLKKFTASYKDVFSKDPVIEVIHAGLECGVIGAKYPEMQMISIGPTIKSPHCPDEKMLVSTIMDIWKLLINYLEFHT